MASQLVEKEVFVMMKALEEEAAVSNGGLWGRERTDNTMSDARWRAQPRTTPHDEGLGVSA